MSLLELIFFSLVVAFMMLCSRGLGHILGVPDALAAVPLIGLLLLLLRLLTKMPRSSLFFFSWFLGGTTFVSIALAHLLRLDLRRSFLFTPILGVAGIVVICGLFRRRRSKQTNTSVAK